MSQSNLLICYEYINNNSYINLSDGNNIKIIYILSQCSKTHKILNITLKIWLPIFQFLKIKLDIIAMTWREMVKKRKNQLILSLLSKKLVLKTMKMVLTLDDRIDKKKKTKKILLWITSLRAYKSKLVRNFFQKITIWLFENCSIVLNEKKN